MIIGEILKNKQSEVHKELLKIIKRKELSSSDYERLMKHDSFTRHNGAVSQRSWGK